MKEKRKRERRERQFEALVRRRFIGTERERERERASAMRSVRGQVVQAPKVKPHFRSHFRIHSGIKYEQQQQVAKVRTKVRSGIKYVQQRINQRMIQKEGRGEGDNDERFESWEGKIGKLACCLACTAALSLGSFSDEALASSILETRRAELEVANAALEKDPKDEIVLAQKTVLETQIRNFESNSSFLSKERPLVAEGRANFLQHAVLEVKDLDKSVKFWTDGLGMRVNRSRGTGKSRQAFVSYGPESLTADNGGKFALELIENPNTSQDNSGQYFQFALPNSLRVNRLFNAGGEITFGYGYFEIDAPDGYKVKVYIDNRRDPFDLIGVYVDDVNSAATYYENVFGMKADRSYVKQKVGQFDPPRPEGGVLMTYGDQKDNTGILLIPKKGQKQSIKIAVLDKDVFERKDKLAALGVEPKFVGPVPGIGTKVALVVPDDGVPLVFVDYDDFEKEQPEPTVLSIKDEVKAFVAMAQDDEN